MSDIKHSIFTKITLVLGGGFLNPQNLGSVDLSGVTISCNGREYCIEHHQTYAWSKDGKHSFELYLSDFEETMDVYGDCLFDLSIADLLSNDVVAKILITCDLDGSEDIFFISGKLHFEIAGKALEIAIGDERQEKHLSTLKSLNLKERSLINTCKAFVRSLDKADLDYFNQLAAQVTFSTRRYGKGVFYTWAHHPIFSSRPLDPWMANKYPKAVLIADIAIRA